MKPLLRLTPWMLMMTLAGAAAQARPTTVRGVIGEDSRTQITPANAEKIHQSFGLIKMDYGTFYGYCTGTVVGPHHVVTAAHCLYDEGKLPAKVTFYPGIKESLRQVVKTESYTSKRFIFKKEYVTSESVENDLGMVFFDEVLPMQPLNVQVAPPRKDIYLFELTITGYPADKPIGTLWESRGRISEVFASIPHSHDLDTFAGMSGSSLRLDESVIGIHSSGFNDANGKCYMNYAHFFTEESVELIRAWLLQ